MSVVARDAPAPVPSTVLEADTEREAPSTRFERLALIGPALVAAAVTLWWFPLDRFIAAGDITPFVRDGTAHELFSLWNHRSTGTGGTSAVVARLFEVALIHLTRLFGGSEMLAQHLEYALVMAAAAFGVAYLARAFVRDPMVVAVAGLLGVFNPYVLVHLPNLLPVLWIALVSVLSGIVLRAARGVPLSPLWFAGTTVAVSYLSVNPPMLATAVVTVLAVAGGASLLVGPGGARRAGRYLVRALPWMVLLNLWWLVPTFLATFHREGVTLSAQTRVQDWSWSHAQNSLSNVVTLKADWGWAFPEYTPYARALDTEPWAWLRWILPLLAVAAPIVTRGRRRRATLALLGAAAAVVLVGKGLHPPFEALNLWLYQHVPGLWLLREPMSKVGGILLLIEVVLAACTLVAVLHGLAHRSGPVRSWGAALLGAGVCLALLFPLPVWSGAFGSDGQHGLPTAVVAVPGEWREVARAVNESPTRGKLLVLPLDRYYQVTTSWGFHGADELVQQLVHRPVLQLLPDGYFSPAGDAATMLTTLESDLVHGRGPAAVTLLHALGVSEVLVRTDVLPSATVPHRADVGALVAGLEHTDGIGPPRRFGVANLYPVTGGGDQVRAAREVVGLTRRADNRRAEAISQLPDGAVAVRPTEVPLDALSWEATGERASSLQFRLRSANRYRLGLDESLPRAWRTEVTATGGAGKLSLVDPVSLTLDGEPLPMAPAMSVPFVGDRLEVVDVGGNLTVRTSSRTEVEVPGPVTVSAYAPSAATARGEHLGRAGSCGGATRDLRAVPIERGIRLHTASGIGCVTVRGPSLSPEGVYRVRFQSRTLTGASPRVCLVARGPDRCVDMEQPAATFGWSTHDVAVRAPAGTTGLVLYLYADATQHGPATVEYRSIGITPEARVGSASVAPRPRPDHIRTLGGGRHRLRISGARAGLALRADTPLGDCQDSDDRSAREAGLDATRISRGVRLTAAAHSACVSADIPDATAGETFHLGLRLRTVSGRRARVCVWQDGPDRCAPIEDLPVSDEWSTYRTQVTLEPGTTAARVYLYADGQSSPRTVTEYRDLEVRVIPPAVFSLSPLDPLPPPPHVTWTQQGTQRFDVRIRDATGPFLLVLDESHAAGWTVEGTQPMAHLTADGYANGWYLRTPESASLVLRYGPARAVRAGYWISALAAGAAIVLVVGRAVRRRRT